MHLLQRSIGNDAMLRLLVSRTGVTRNEPGEQGTNLVAPIQAKLAVGTVDDPLEQEADRIAAQVMDTTAPAAPISATAPHTSGESAAGEAPDSVQEALRLPGQPLDATTRAFFEPRFGQDLSQVRLHTGALADRSARDLNAHAYTVGDDIVFAAGQFSPATSHGRRLVAHELTHVLQQRAGSTSPANLQRQPVAPAGPFEQEQALPPRPISAPALIPGDPVPGYEQPRLKYDKADIEVFWSQLHQREKDNKTNCANFIGAYGKAVAQLWGRHVSEVMAEAGKSAGWSFFDKTLKFLAIKTIEIVAGTLLTPASVEIFALIGKEVTEKVAEIGISVAAAYAAEHGAEHLEDHTKESQIDVAKEDIDKVTEKVAARLGDVTVSTIKSLPDITPYAKRLSEADKTGSYAQLAGFRLPPLFPVINARDVYRIVAELLIVLLNDASAGRGKAGGGFISVEGTGFNDAEIRVPSKELRAAVSGKSIRDLPLMPLRIMVRSNNIDGIRPIGTKLLSHFRVAPAADEVDEFIKATGEADMPPAATGYLSYVLRSSEGVVDVTGETWALRTYLYQWATSDLNLGRLADEIRASGGTSCRDESEDVGEEAVCRMLSPTEIGTKMMAYLASHRPMLLDGARALITQHVEKLYPVAKFPGNE